MTEDRGLRRPPCPRLRPYLASLTGYRMPPVPGGRHRGLPSPHLTVILALDEPMVLHAHSGDHPVGPPGRGRDYPALLAGLHTSPTVIGLDRGGSGIQLALRPAGARALFGLPAAALVQDDVPLEAVVGGWAERLRQQVAAQPGWPARLDVLEAELCRRLDSASCAGAELPATVATAWRLLTRQPGTPVGALADALGWSPRHLRQVFRAEIGLGLKEAARLVRFDLARRDLFARAAGPADWSVAQVAGRWGYADQAHLAREFRALAGAAPTVLLREELRFVQAPPTAPGPRSWHD